MLTLKILNFKLGQKGFSLAEGMVTAGLLGVVSLAMLQGLKEDSKTKQLMRQEDEIQSVMATVGSLMGNSVACSATFAAAGNPDLSGTNNIGNLYNDGGVPATYTPPGDGATPVTLSEGVAFQGGNLVISSITNTPIKRFFQVQSRGPLGGADTKVYGMVELRVAFTQIAQKRTVTVPRSINVTVAVSDSGTFIECANPADIVALQLKEKMCAMTYSPTGENYVVGSFDASTGQCAGIAEGINYIGSKVICLETGGKVVPDPADPSNTSKWVCSFKAPSCITGIQGFDGFGNPICAP
tara:strand:+ start:1416 stop:2306 length:891 start_codon:yes stop_codon:yes gene_type:complete